jgi:F-type H+-transporting ATPase subunit alpha
MHRGMNVYVGFDDFTKHAWCYREISLLLGRAPGRDSYPGDIFYLHSKMIERACLLSEEHGGGSMTFLPIVEILEGDLTAFIPTNLVSMTDGQIMLDAQLFGEGQRPALDLGLSVSRVGTKVQWPIIKELSGPLRLEYLQFRELQRLSKLRSANQSEDVQQRLKSGEILTQLLRQDKDHPVIMEALVLILYAFQKKYLHKLTTPEIDRFQLEILEYAQKNNPNLIQILRERKKKDEEIENGINEVLRNYTDGMIASRVEEEVEKSEEIVSNLGRDVLDEATTKKSA